MWVPDEPMGAANKPRHELGTLLVDDIVMRCASGVPQLEASDEKVGDGENGQPFCPSEALHGDAVPVEAGDLGKHRKSVEAVNPCVLIGGFSKGLRIKVISAQDQGRVAGNGSLLRSRCLGTVVLAKTVLVSRFLHRGCDWNGGPLSKHRPTRLSAV